MRHFSATHLATAAVAAIVATGAMLVSPCAQADSVSGTLSYQSKAGAINLVPKNVYLVKGPNSMDGKVMRRLIFTPLDLGAKIKACATMSCSDSDLGEGLEVDLVAGPRMNYWFVGNGQKVQYSGTAKPETLTLTTDTPQRLAGKLVIDDSAAGGAKVNIDFDATLLKEFAK